MAQAWIPIAAALALSGGAPAAAQPSPTALPPELKALVDNTRSEQLKPGPVVAGWNVGGADPNAEIERRGADKHYFLEEHDDGDADVSIRTTRRIDSLAPAAWRPIDSFGSAVDYVERPTVSFSPLGTRYAIGARSGEWRENGIDCGKGPSHAILYERPDGPKDDLDRDEAIVLFRITMLAIEHQTVCARHDGNARDGWRTRLMLRDGRDLPELNKGQSRLRIVPAAPVESLVKGKPMPAAAARR